MRRSRLAAIAIVAMLATLVLTVSGCTVGSTSSEYSDPSTPIKVEKGSDFTIVLDSNPTTGYQWQFASAIDENVISLSKTEYVKSEPATIGSGGQEKWTFTAEGIGETSINLTYVRPWETQSGQEQTTEGSQSEEGSNSEQQAAQQEPTNVTFDVIVVKKGGITGTPKQYKDDGQTIEAEKNVDFEIVLEANHTTGYEWQLTEPLDSSILEVASTAYAAKSGEGATEGAGGEETWTIDPVGVGNATISLELVRPWETGVQPAEEKTFTVQVSEPSDTSSE
jgi:predicted secreted protein